MKLDTCTFLIFDFSGCVIVMRIYVIIFTGIPCDKAGREVAGVEDEYMMVLVCLEGDNESIVRAGHSKLPS